MRSSRLISALLLSGSLLASSATVSLAQVEAEEVAAAPPATEWTVVEDAPWPAKKDWWLYDAAATPDGDVVVVGGPFGGQVNAWTTADGETWVTSPLPFEQASHPWMSETPWGIELFAGTGASQVMSSTVDGEKWSKPTTFKKALLSGRDVTASTAMLAGATGRLPKSTPALWRSEEGGKYERLGLGDVRKKSYAAGVAVLPDNELLVATNNPTTRKPKLHRGSWGGNWEDVALPTGGPAQPDFLALAGVADGIVLSAQDRESHVLWFSPDGANWEVVTEASPGYRPIQSGDDVLILGDPILRSSNGTDWCELGAPEGEVNLWGMTEFPDGRLLLVGVEHRKVKKNKPAVTFPTAWVTDDVNCEPDTPESEMARDESETSRSEVGEGE